MNNKSEKLDQEMIHRYFDGALSAEEVLYVEQLLEKSNTARDYLDKIEKTNNLLRSSFAKELETVDFSSFWDNIDNKIQNNIEIESIEKEYLPAKKSMVYGVLAKIKQIYTSIVDLIIAHRTLSSALVTISLLLVIYPIKTKMPFVEIPSSPLLVGDLLSEAVNDGNIDSDNLVSHIDDDPNLNTKGVIVNNVSSGQGATVMVLNSPEQATIIWIDEDLQGQDEVQQMKESQKIQEMQQKQHKEHVYGRGGTSI